MNTYRSIQLLSGAVHNAKPYKPKCTSCSNPPVKQFNNKWYCWPHWYAQRANMVRSSDG